MALRCLKSLLVLGFSVCMVFNPNVSKAQEPHAEGQAKEGKKINPAKIILEHVADGHEFHFASINGKHITIPLPVILYAPEKGFSVFMSSRFHHGEENYRNYMMDSLVILWSLIPSVVMWVASKRKMKALAPLASA